MCQVAAASVNVTTRNGMGVTIFAMPAVASFVNASRKNEGGAGLQFT